MLDQEKINEESYKELYLGKKQDPSKDSRWHAIKGLGRSIGILSGVLEKAKSGYYFGCNYEETQQIIDFCTKQIPLLGDKKERLKHEVKADQERRKSAKGN